MSMDKWTNGGHLGQMGNPICPDNKIGQMVCGYIYTHTICPVVALKCLGLIDDL